MRASIGLATLLLVIAGCSASPDAAAPNQVATPAMGSPEAKASPSVKGAQEPGPSKKPPASRGSNRPGDKGGAKPTSGQSPSPAKGTSAPAVASASRADPSGDADGSEDPPPYTDIRAAALRGEGGALTLTLRVDGPIERSLAEGTDMTVNFRLDRKRGRDHQIYAIGTSQGWRADLDNSGSFPGRFTISNDRFVFELPWKRLGGASRLRWETETAWTKAPSGPLGQTEFAFDRVPEHEPAIYPE